MGIESEPGWIELFQVPWRLVNEINQVSARLKHICSRHGGSKWRKIQWPNSGYSDVWRSIENRNGSEPGWIDIVLGPLDDLSMKTIRFQPGSNIFVAAMEIQKGEKFNGLTVVIGMFGVP